MAVVFAILAACLCATGGTPSAEKGFAQIQSIVQAADADELQSILPDAAFYPWRGAQVEELRAALAKELAHADVVKIRDDEGRAVVRYRLPGDKAERELPLRLVDETWLVAAARGFPVSGNDLKQRKGRRFAKAKLTMRTTNDSYAESALSFVHATDDPELCGNRMDLWYCHNGDFHACGGNRVADLGKTTLKKIKGLPVAPDWQKTVKLQEKHSYLVQCQSRRRTDFFVILYVKKQKQETVDVEWTLLTGGLAPPASIAIPQLVGLGDPVDAPSLGTDGLCGKHG